MIIYLVDCVKVEYNLHFVATHLANMSLFMFLYILIAQSIISDLLTSLRIDSNNYDSWDCKIKYLLSENNLIDLISRQVARPWGNCAVEMQRQ